LILKQGAFGYENPWAREFVKLSPALDPSLFGGDQEQDQDQEHE
jgi:hypothetical protein